MGGEVSSKLGRRIVPGVPVMIVVVQVSVIEVQARRRMVIVGRAVHVAQPGEGAENQVKGAAAQCNEPSHALIVCAPWIEGKPPPVRPAPPQKTHDTLVNSVSPWVDTSPSSEVPRW
jgi:hypothetical protein